MTRSSKRHLVLAVTALFALLAPSVAFAGGKGGGGNHAGNGSKPSESMSLNYGKIEHTYSAQKGTSGTKSGKVHVHDISVQKKLDKSSPDLFQ